MEMTMNGRVAQAVQVALRGSRQVRITFKKEAAKMMGYFLEMVRNGMVSISKDDQYILATVALCHSWAEDDDRTVVATLTGNFDQERFVRRMAIFLEKIEVLGD